MKLPRYTAETPPPRFAGAARAGDIGALTQTGDIEVWRGVSQVGGAMQRVAGLGYRVWQERHNIDTGIQHAKSTSAMNTAYTNIIGEVRSLPVETEAAREKLRSQYSKQLQDLYNQVSKGLDNPDAANAFRRSWETLKSQYDTGIYRTLTGNLDKQQKYDKMTEWEGMISNAPTENLEAVKENIKKDVEKHIPLFGAAWAKTFIGNLDRRTAVVREDYYNDLIYNGTSDLGVLAELIRADDSVNKKQLLNNIDEEQGRRSGLAEKELEEQQEQDRDVIGDAINSGIVPEGHKSIYDLINQSSLDEDEQHQKIQWARQEAERIAERKEIVRDDEAYDLLDDRIIDYHIGTENKDAILKDLRNARFETEPTLPQKDYEYLKGKLQTEVTKLNAKYLKEARAVLRDAIVTDAGALFGQDKDEKIEFRAVAAGLEEDINAGKFEGKAILEEAFIIAERYIEDPIGRIMDKLQKQKEQMKELKERRGEAPKRGTAPAGKIKDFLRQRGWGG